MSLRAGGGGAAGRAQAHPRAFISARRPLHMKYKLRMEPEAGAGGRGHGLRGPGARPRRTTWSGRPRMAAGPSRTSCAAAWRRRSRPAPPPSTCRTPWATRCRTTWRASSPMLRERGAGRRRRGPLDAQPQRPRPGGGQHAGGGARRARARSSARSTASASGPATPRSRRSSWRSAPGRTQHPYAQPDREHAEHACGPAQAAGDHHRVRRAAEQGDRRAQRLRA